VNTADFVIFVDRLITFCVASAHIFIRLTPMLDPVAADLSKEALRTGSFALNHFAMKQFKTAAPDRDISIFEPVTRSTFAG
jgi:hypothetical protein